MEITDKLIKALGESLDAEYIQLDDDEGVSGFVVSSRFEKLSGLDRQRLIDDAVRRAADPLTDEERRRILMIAGLTPLEYESAGARTRVHSVRDIGDGWLEVLLRGNYADAAYVRGALDNRKGVTTTEPEQSPGAVGILMAFRAKGSEANPLPKDEVIRMLQADPYIEIMQTA